MCVVRVLGTQLQGLLLTPPRAPAATWTLSHPRVDVLPPGRTQVDDPGAVYDAMLRLEQGVDATAWEEPSSQTDPDEEYDAQTELEVAPAGAALLVPWAQWAAMQEGPSGSDSDGEGVV